MYDINIDLVNDNVHTKFNLNRFIRFQDMEQKLILTSIKGRNSVANLPKFELIQALCMPALPARMKKIQLKIKAL